jgi:hypothetical protein
VSVNFSNINIAVKPDVKPKITAPQLAFTAQQDTVSFKRNKNKAKQADNAEPVSEAKVSEEKSKEKLSVVKSLAKGFISPAVVIGKALINHTMASIAMIVITAAAMRYIKLFGTLLTTGICAFGAFKIGKGTAGAVKAVKAEKAKDDDERNYAKANKQIEGVGEGLFDVALTVTSAINNLKSLTKSVKAVKNAKEANTYQRVYAILKQIEKSDDVLQGPADLAALKATIRQEGASEWSQLKNNIFGGSAKNTPKAAKSIKSATDQLLSNKEVLQELPPTLQKKVIAFASNNEMVKLTESEINMVFNAIKTIESQEQATTGAKMVGEVARRVNNSDDIMKVISKRVKAMENPTKAARSDSLSNDDR